MNVIAGTRAHQLIVHDERVLVNSAHWTAVVVNVDG
jgi:hypothetical protein